MYIQKQTYRCLSLLFVFIIVSCNSDRQKLTKDMQSFLSETVSIPERMVVVESGHLSEVKTLLGEPKLVRYFGPDACSDCAITHIFENEPLYDLEKEVGGFSVMMVFSPKEENVPHVTEKLLSCDFPHRVYLDTEGKLHELNVPNRNDKFRCFLIDFKGKPVYVGNPCNSEKLRQLFFEALSVIK